MLAHQDANMAVGFKASLKQIKALKAAIADMKDKVKAVSKKHKKGMRDVLKAHGAFKRCSKSKIVQLKAAKVGFKAAVKKEGTKQMLANTRVELARRALAMCEKRNEGSSNKAVARLKRRTKRAVKREKRKL